MMLYLDGKVLNDPCNAMKDDKRFDGRDGDELEYDRHLILSVLESVY